MSRSAVLSCSSSSWTVVRSSCLAWPDVGLHLLDSEPLGNEGHLVTLSSHNVRTGLPPRLNSLWGGPGYSYYCIRSALQQNWYHFPEFSLWKELEAFFRSRLICRQFSKLYIHWSNVFAWHSKKNSSFALSEPISYPDHFLTSEGISSRTAAYLLRRRRHPFRLCVCSNHRRIVNKGMHDLYTGSLLCYVPLCGGNLDTLV